MLSRLSSYICNQSGGGIPFDVYLLNLLAFEVFAVVFVLNAMFLAIRDDRVPFGNWLPGSLKRIAGRRSLSRFEALVLTIAPWLAFACWFVLFAGGVFGAVVGWNGCGSTAAGAMIHRWWYAGAAALAFAQMVLLLTQRWRFRPIR